jgi:Na+/phosphate symporter
MREQVEAMLVRVITHCVSEDGVPAARTTELEHDVDTAQTNIKAYLAEPNQSELTPQQADRSMLLAIVAISHEQLVDIITKDLKRLVRFADKARHATQKPAREVVVFMSVEFIIGSEISIFQMIVSSLD